MAEQLALKVHYGREGTWSPGSRAGALIAGLALLSHQDNAAVQFRITTSNAACCLSIAQAQHREVPVEAGCIWRCCLE